MKGWVKKYLMNTPTLLPLKGEGIIGNPVARLERINEYGGALSQPEQFRDAKTRGMQFMAGICACHLFI